MKKYSRQKTIDELNKSLANINNLYKARCINWKGTANGSNEQYSEIIAQALSNCLEEFDKIPKVTRKNSYYRKNHCNIKIDICKSNRDEENFSKRITDLELETLGLIKDFQIPLKDTLKNAGIGKIDLISYNAKNKTLFIIELKYTGNKETLLRAIIESYTYYKIVDTTKLIKDFLKDVNPNKIKIIPSVLLVPGCNSYNELKEMKIGKRPHLKALSLKLGVKLFTVELLTNEIQL